LFGQLAFDFRGVRFAVEVGGGQRSVSVEQVRAGSEF
jgi:hypothetical protein